MTLHALLEDFATPRHAAGPAEAGPALLEEERLAAFEAGYGAGYDDATAAAAKERRRVGAALAGRLEDLAFTYHEARAAMLREMRDLMEAIGDGLLPGLAREGFGAALAQAVGEEIAARAPCPVSVSVAPEEREVVAPLMPEVPGFPVTLAGDPDLAPGQAVIAFPGAERALDMAPVVARARGALAEWLAGGMPAAPEEAAQGSGAGGWGAVDEGAMDGGAGDRVPQDGAPQDVAPQGGAPEGGGAASPVGDEGARARMMRHG